MSMAQSIHPGPIDSSLLTMQLTHVSESIWSIQECTTKVFTCRRADGGMWSMFIDEYGEDGLDRRILNLLHVAGFYGVYRLGQVQLDHALITALVERWRPETHTFHLPIGEATVTGQDLQYIAGLRFDGLPVTSSRGGTSSDTWVDIVEAMLGLRPPLPMIKKSSIKTTWLCSTFRKLPNDADEVDIIRYTRAYILLLLGGMLLPGKESDTVKLHYLPLLEDLALTGQYSWGGAVLATLYRELCVASNTPGHKQISGPLVLLQLWAWERISVLRPIRRGVDSHINEHDHIADNDVTPTLPRPPIGSRWRVSFDMGCTPSHVLLSYRYSLDTLREEQFNWQPYNAISPNLVPEYCTIGSQIWRARVPLINIEVVEGYLPDRVLRQFGFPQHVPLPPNTFPDLHKLTRRGYPNRNWEQFHAPLIEMWNNRENLVVDPQPPSPDYNRWYMSITRRLIHNPAHSTPSGFVSGSGRKMTLGVAMAKVYDHVQQVRATHMAMSPAEFHTWSDKLLDICTTSMEQCGLRDMLGATYQWAGESSQQQTPTRLQKKRRANVGSKY